MHAISWRLVAFWTGGVVVIGLLAILSAVLTMITSNAEWTPIVQEFNGAAMVLVPRGCFMMGSTDYEDEQPIHQQCFEQPFWLDQTEVTRAMYALCVADGQCLDVNRNTLAERDRQPINYLAWSQARNYCEWRGVRLPTEAEWEYAARGPDSLVYPWGNEFIEENFVYTHIPGKLPDPHDELSQLADVGTKPPGASWVGALDMIGNAWEWTSSLYQAYPYDKDDGREDVNGSAPRVLRGNSWSKVNRPTAAFRSNVIPSFMDGLTGVRCARDDG